MVVDNAIVVLDGYLEYLNKGMSRWTAACKSVQQYFMPMTLATVCLCAIFFPTLFTTTGMISEMCFYMPWTLTINLGISLALAVVVLPVWEAAFIRKRKITKNKHVDVSKPTSRVGDVTEDEKNQVEAAIKELEEALAGNDLELIKAKKDALLTAAQGVATKAYQKAQNASQQEAGSQNDDGTINADFEDVSNK